MLIVFGCLMCVHVVLYVYFCVGGTLILLSLHIRVYILNIAGVKIAPNICQYIRNDKTERWYELLSKNFEP